MDKFKCVVLDDEIGAIQILSRYIEKTPNLELIKTFRRSIDGLGFLTENSIDLLFLDINMPELDGLNLSRLLTDKKELKIIFTTAYSKYAVESYEHGVVDYLLKPIPLERFLKSVNRAIEVIKSEKSTLSKQPTTQEKELNSIFIKSGTTIHQIELDKILYMEKDGHYISFHTTDGEVLSRMKMDQLIEAMPTSNFIRTHRSYVVAIDKIDTIQKQFVIIGKKEIPIGDMYRNPFFERIKFSGG
jgi:DNA-binding LytR/AlgR family response regulator